MPGDRLRLEVTLGRARPPLARVHGSAYVGDQVVAEARCSAIEQAGSQIDPRAVVHPGAEIGDGTVVGPYAVDRAARADRHGAAGSARRPIIDGWTEIGDGTEVFPFASIGLMPQDLKYRGEPTRLVIGKQHLPRVRDRAPRHRGRRRR